MGYDPSLIVEQIPPEVHFARECLRALNAEGATVSEMIERAKKADCNPVKEETPIGAKILKYVRQDLPEYLTELKNYVEVYRTECGPNLRSERMDTICTVVDRTVARYLELLSECSMPSTEKEMYRFCLDRSIETFNINMEEIRGTEPRKYVDTCTKVRVPVQIALPRIMQTAPKYHVCA